MRLVSILIIACSWACAHAPTRAGATPEPWALPASWTTGAVGSISVLPDGGALVAGYARESATAEAVVVRYDAKGTLLWSRRLGAAGPLFSFDAEPAGDDAVVVGWTTSGDETVVLARVGANGERWRVPFGAATNERAMDVTPTPGGGFVFVMQTGLPYPCVPSESSDPPCEDMRASVIAVDDTGRERWRYDVDGPGRDRLYYVVADPSGVVTAAGITQTHAGSPWDMLVVRLGPAGTHLWTRTIGGAGSDFNHGIALAPAGGVAVAGYGSSGARGANDVWLVRLDAAGEELWRTVVDGAGDDHVIRAANDGADGFLLVGYSREDSAAPWRATLSAVDERGALRWTRTFPGERNVMGQAVAALPGAILLGGSAADPSNRMQPFLKLLKENGQAN